MKIRVKLLYGIVTIGILLTGFLLPRQVWNMQDVRQESRVDRYELNSITLNVSGQLLEKLSAVQQGEIIPLTFADTEMSVKDVQQKMLEINEMLGFYPMEAEDITYQAEAKLVIDETNEISFVIWRGRIEDDYRDIEILLDDTTGKMLCIDIIGYIDAVYPDITKLEPDISPEELGGILKDYYELAAVEILIIEDGGTTTDVNANTDASANEAAIANRYDVTDIYKVPIDYGVLSQKCIFRLFNEDGSYYDLMVYVDEDMYLFNCY